MYHLLQLQAELAREAPSFLNNFQCGSFALRLGFNDAMDRAQQTDNRAEKPKLRGALVIEALEDFTKLQNSTQI